MVIFKRIHLVQAIILGTHLWQLFFVSMVCCMYPLWWGEGGRAIFPSHPDSPLNSLTSPSQMRFQNSFHGPAKNLCPKEHRKRTENHWFRMTKNDVSKSMAVDFWEFFFTNQKVWNQLVSTPINDGGEQLQLCWGWKKVNEKTRTFGGGNNARLEPIPIIASRTKNHLRKKTLHNIYIYIYVYMYIF